MKKIIIIVLILVFLALSAILIPGFYIKDWKKFQSVKNEYSVQYPPYWQSNEIDDDIFLHSHTQKGESFPPKGEVWVDFITQTLKDPNQFDSLVQQVANATKKEKKLTNKIKKADKAYNVGPYLYVLKGNKFYSILIYYNQPSLKNKINSALIVGSFELD